VADVSGASTWGGVTATVSSALSFLVVRKISVTSIIA